MEFCDCEKRGLTVLRYNFWPISVVKPTVVVSLELMEMLRVLTMECSISTTGFSNALKYKFLLFPGYKPIVSQK